MAQGNAVTARWVGPAGFQLFDGTLLNPGAVIDGVGFDEAENSDYWEVVKGSAAKNPDGDASANRVDWSFGLEEGGAGTGRPEVAADEVVAPAPEPVVEVVEPAPEVVA